MNVVIKVPDWLGPMLISTARSALTATVATVGLSPIFGLWSHGDYAAIWKTACLFGVTFGGNFLHDLWTSPVTKQHLQQILGASGSSGQSVPQMIATLASTCPPGTQTAPTPPIAPPVPLDPAVEAFSEKVLNTVIAKLTGAPVPPKL